MIKIQELRLLLFILLTIIYRYLALYTGNSYLHLSFWLMYILTWKGRCLIKIQGLLLLPFILLTIINRYIPFYTGNSYLPLNFFLLLILFFLCQCITSQSTIFKTCQEFFWVKPVSCRVLSFLCKDTTLCLQKNLSSLPSHEWSTLLLSNQTR